MTAAIDTLLAAASRALTDAWGAPVTLYLQSPIRTEWGRHRLLLCNVDGPETRPDMVVVKAAVEQTGVIFNEWAALEFLGHVDSVARHVPTLYAGDIEHQLIVIEDVGDGPSLHRLMQTRREWAVDAMVQSMKLLADVHAATRGRRSDFATLRGELPEGADPPVFELSAAALVATMELWGGDLPSEVAVDVERAAAALIVPDSFLCLTFHDACPVNRIVTGDGVRAVDLEMAGFRHPMVDGAYAAIGHLRCSARRLRANDGIAIPPEVSRPATEAYRDRILAGYPEYADPERFDRDLAAASVVWMVEILRRVGPRLLGKDPSGFFKMTARQRVLEVLNVTATLPEVDEHYAAVGPWAMRLLQCLCNQWPPTPPLLRAAAFGEDR